MRLPITVELAGGNHGALSYSFSRSSFFIGLAGSMVVAVMAFVGDFTDFFEKDKPEGAATRAIGD
jgi:hypothetical protein